MTFDLTENDHDTMDRYLLALLRAYKGDDITQSHASSSLAHSITLAALGRANEFRSFVEAVPKDLARRSKKSSGGAGSTAGNDARFTGEGILTPKNGRGFSIEFEIRFEEDNLLGPIEVTGSAEFLELASTETDVVFEGAGVKCRIPVIGFRKDSLSLLLQSAAFVQAIAKATATKRHSEKGNSPILH